MYNTPVVKVALITEPTGDHLPAYRRVSLCKGIDRLEENPDLASFKPDLAIISMEPNNSPPAIERALTAGAHVLTEKPSCTRFEQFERLARHKDRQIMLAMATRLHPDAISIHKKIASGSLGKLYSVNMIWHADQTRLRNPQYQQTWFAKRDKSGGGKLIFHGIHYLDLIRFLTGDSITKVTALLNNAGGEAIEVEDSAVVAMQFASGMTGTLHTGYYLDKGYENTITIWGEKGWVRFDPRKANPPPNMYDLCLQAAVDFARGAAPPFMTTEDSLAALSTVFEAYRSAETGVAGLPKQYSASALRK